MRQSYIPKLHIEQLTEKLSKIEIRTGYDMYKAHKIIKEIEQIERLFFAKDKK